MGGGGGDYHCGCLCTKGLSGERETGLVQGGLTS